MPRQVEAAGLFPAVEHLQEYADLLDSFDRAHASGLQAVDGGGKREDDADQAMPDKRKVSEVLSKFMSTARLPHQRIALKGEEEDFGEGRASLNNDSPPPAKYFVCDHEEPANVANRLHDVSGPIC